MKFIEGSIPSPRDDKDFISTAIIARDIKVPSKSFWDVPIVRDQLIYGTCVGFGTSQLKNIQEVTQKDYVTGGFSPLFIYTLCKQADGIPDVEGTYIRTAMKVLTDYGTVSEVDLPYKLMTDKFTYPDITSDLVTKAKRYKIKEYAQVPKGDLLAIKQALLTSPLATGVLVCSSFLDPKGGFIPKPEGSMLGGHCILITGYDDDLVHTYPDGVTKKGFFKFVNSWSDKWGDGGFGYIPYSLVSYKTDNGTGFSFFYEFWSAIDLIVAPEAPKYYKVQVGAFKVKENCQRFVEEVKSKGFPTYMPPPDSDGLYRVQLGAFNVKDNAYTLRDKVVAAGLKGAFVVYK